MLYNSYLIVDDKIAIKDAVDKLVLSDWIDNILSVLKNRKSDYLIIQHVEPDHSYGVKKLLELYPDVTLVGKEMAFTMLSNFFRDVEFKSKLIIKENDELSLGEHKLKFIFATMVH